MLDALLFFLIALWGFMSFPSLPMAAIVLAPLVALPLWWACRSFFRH